MSKHIDLSQFSEDELIELNQKIVERLMSLRQHRRFEEMARFNIGDTVSFTPEPGRVIVGKIARANTKTITVISTNGQRWRVAPTFLSHTTDGQLSERAVEQGQLLSLVPSGGTRRP